MSFAKENELLQVKAGFVDGNALDAKGVQTLSKLPSKPELQGSVLQSINSAMAVLVTAIDSLFAEIGGLVEAQEKALGGETAEAPAGS
jgi:large subunit ribosomal protein L10